mgnify:CR=1 FL=1
MRDKIFLVPYLAWKLEFLEAPCILILIIHRQFAERLNQLCATLAHLFGLLCQVAYLLQLKLLGTEMPSLIRE